MGEIRRYIQILLGTYVMGIILKAEFSMVRARTYSGICTNAMRNAR